MQTRTIPITLQISISLPEGVTLAPQVLTESDAWQYTAAPVGGGDSRSVDLRFCDTDVAEVQSPAETVDATHASEPKEAGLPQVSNLTAHTSQQPADPLGSIVSDQNVASSDAERRAELEQFLASIPDVLPASANIHDRDLQFLGKLLRGQLNEDIERRAAARSGRAAKKESASRSVDLSPRETEAVKAQAEVAPDDAAHASVETNATTPAAPEDVAHATETGHVPLPHDSNLTSQASLKAEKYDTRGSVLGRLFNAHERLKVEVRELREELARTQAALVANGSHGVNVPRSADFGPRTQPAATPNAPTQDAWVTTNATNEPSSAPATGASPTATGSGDALPPQPTGAARKPKRKLMAKDVLHPYANLLKEDLGEVTLDGRPLTPKQTNAAIYLAMGATYVEAGREVGRDRRTVQRWMREDPAFQALYNSHLNNLQESLEARMLGMGNDAARVFQAHIEHGSFRAANALLKGIGIFDGKRRQKTRENAYEFDLAESAAPLPTEPRFDSTQHERNGHAEKLEV